MNFTFLFPFRKIKQKSLHLVAVLAIVEKIVNAPSASSWFPHSSLLSRGLEEPDKMLNCNLKGTQIINENPT